MDKVILKDSTNSESGYNSHDNRSHLVGKTAQTVTDLRPAGIIFCENERIDAVSDGNFILRNKTVKILEVEGTESSCEGSRLIKRSDTMFSLSFIVIAVIIVVALLILLFICTHWFMDFSVSSWRSCWYRYIGWYAFTSYISTRKVIAPLIKAHKAGLALTTNQLESHYLTRKCLDESC